MPEGQVIMAVLMPHAPVLVPDVGGERGIRASASIHAMRVAARRVNSTGPDTVIVISPHTPRRHGTFAVWSGERIHGSLAQFGAEGCAVDFPNDNALAEAIVREAGSRGVKTWWLEGEELDHGATVPLWHLGDAGWSGPAVVIGLNFPGEHGLRELGESITAAARRVGRRVAVVASGDMSHRLQHGAPAGFHPRAKDFDRVFIERLREGDYGGLLEIDPELQELAAEDAVDSTVVAAAAVNWNAAGHQVLGYEGPFGVGYGVAILHERTSGTPRAAAASADEDIASCEAWNELPGLARRSVESAFAGYDRRSRVQSRDKPSAAHGVFVTIRGPGGKLRGCVGTLTPRCEDTASETWRVARCAAFNDQRFPPVKRGELEHLNFEVSVVFPLETVASESELDPARYGVVVSAGDGRQGALLPDIEGVGTVDEQLRIARRKAGIDESEPVQLQRFVVKRICEAGSKVEHRGAKR
ncbi:MAG TPA: class III extradiol ring-cleavage dioxygenase family protein [Verrucomicrobiota bacterium]|nr:class III extradiol ring-cleavage dioxygenase family protein [Verrucomicrobiota bacterium]